MDHRTRDAAGRRRLCTYYTILYTAVKESKKRKPNIHDIKSSRKEKPKRNKQTIGTKRGTMYRFEPKVVSEVIT